VVSALGFICGSEEGQERGRFSNGDGGHLYFFTVTSIITGWIFFLSHQISIGNDPFLVGVPWRIGLGIHLLVKKSSIVIFLSLSYGQSAMKWFWFPQL
jgi:hypothetical protein